ncbi:hypothetical protein QNI19_15285 [Cytophagaceae bacterium DM2B3-1]|uniref:Uncharacterized protein n=1 Tax=Xanthocytophaga flava TaxID=3048013 RepID=A0ABT7CKN4_9BACT|nr:hypothetical protein [Xanthocytophaga flavus]MDJ1494306.1 hypothetical protein [Xanthocytophaga flavus]
MKTWFVLLFSGLTLSAFGQNTPSGYDAQQNLNMAGATSGGGMTVVRGFDNRYEGLRGSPYLLQHWCNADVTLANSKIQNDVPVKYDVYSNRLVMRRSQGDSAIVVSSSVKGFLLKDVLTGQNRLFERFPDLKTDDAILKEEYLEVLYEGKTALLVRYDKKVLKASYQGAYSSGRTYDELMDEKNYYIRKADQTISKVKLGKKSVLEHLNASDDLKKFVEQEKLDLKETKDVIRLMEFADK